MAAGKNENKEKKKVNGGGRKSCGSGKGGNFYFCFYLFIFFFEVGNGLDGAEMVVCGDEGKYLKKILFPGRECLVVCVRITIRMYYVRAHSMNTRKHCAVSKSGRNRGNYYKGEGNGSYTWMLTYRSGDRG